MYSNNVTDMNRVMNYMNNNGCKSDSSIDTHKNSCNESTSLSSNDSGSFTDNNNSNNFGIPQKSISVILTGPFTPTQVAMTRQKTNVRPRKSGKHFPG